MLTLRTQTMQRLGKLLDEIRALPERHIEEILWNLSWDPEDTLGYLGFYEDVTAAELEFIRNEIIAETRYQNPKWDFGKRYKKFVSNESLLARSVEDNVILDRIVEKIQNAGKKNRKRSLALLQEGKTFEGIHELGFYCRESEYLVKYSEGIKDILKEF